MATAFRPVNPTAPPPEVRVEEMTSPPTPRQASTPQSQHIKPADDATTPTRATFATAMNSQMPLPTTPFPQAVRVPENAEPSKPPQSEASQSSRKSIESEDVEMDDSDGVGDNGEEGGGSDDESVNADGSRSSKKKKSMRFYCLDYPPCNLSFTRSEHLARHIRKHTGERPFQCHCSRRFSRLDNLRQHAQTVHVNEEIPVDSLAATGSRFQRQMRTDRVRPSGRARASTAGSTGGPIRGHSKSLSTSSITSIGSVGSAYATREDVRRRPPPLVMADQRARLSLESYRSAGDSSYSSYRPASPSDFSTPTSATFSTGQSSPRWGSGIASPTSTHSRSHSMYAGSRTPGRRLSVPSGGNPFQSPHGASVGRPVFGPAGMNSSNSGAFSPASSSLLSSPTPSSTAFSVRRDSVASNADEAWRRRTWHPDTRNLNNTSSGLSNVMTPAQLQPHTPPMHLQPQPNHPPTAIRLPGIESFDPVPRGVSPPKRQPSPMMIDSESNNPPTLLPAADTGNEGRKNVAHWDMGLHRGLTRLDISKHNTPPRDAAGSWASEANQAVQAQAEQVRLNPPTVRFDVEPSPSFANANAGAATRALHQHTLSAPSMTTPRDNRRHGWYNGPVTVHAKNGPPHGVTSDPRVARVERMVHPNIAAFSVFPPRDAQQQNPEHPPVSSEPDPLRRLEALVAVATSEGSTATAY